MAERVAGFTDKQRKAILERDGFRCQFPPCLKDGPVCGDGQCTLHVHHVIPKAYGVKIGLEPNYPENGLTVGKAAHDMIHPDIKGAKVRYVKGDKEAIKRVFDDREQKLKRREIYWNPQWDREMVTAAVLRTQKAKNKGWVFPVNGHDKPQSQKSVGQVPSPSSGGSESRNGAKK